MKSEVLSRVRHEEIVLCKGFDMVIKTIDIMDYDGWRNSDKFEVYLGGKCLGYYYGYPVKKDLLRLLNNELQSEPS